MSSYYNFLVIITWIKNYDSKKLKINLRKLKILLYFGNAWYYSAVLDAFTEVRESDMESSPDTLRVLLAGFASKLGA